ncbi:MAG TPA: hypothetical protein VMC41_04270, partial [Candidatus Nanoarchaeia archaeon]|nr:hypothetical protein [Candidatus Nanoarchaeia archaeon]
GFPNIFLQAARARTPILSLAVDPDGFIAKHQGGIVCGDNYEKLKTGLAILLGQDDLRARAGENLYRYFRAEHDLAKNISQWEELLRKL